MDICACIYLPTTSAYTYTAFCFIAFLPPQPRFPSVIYLSIASYWLASAWSLEILISG
jgi:hypothetical protein